MVVQTAWLGGSWLLAADAAFTLRNREASLPALAANPMLHF
jgi:hypothetical protein